MEQEQIKYELKYRNQKYIQSELVWKMPMLSKEMKDTINWRINVIDRKLQILARDIRLTQERLDRLEKSTNQRMVRISDQLYKKAPRTELFNEKECILCWENEATMRFVPCYHKCLCSTCLPRYQGKFICCPMCREEYRLVI